MSRRPPGPRQASGPEGSGGLGGELDEVAPLLGHPPRGDLSVVRRRPDGVASVIENAPFLWDGTPMPTRFWLVDPDLRAAVSNLEAEGGVRAAAAAVDPARLARAHERYAAARDALIPAGRTGPRPTGGVGGARAGVKCLHAHYAWWLTGGDDPVGEWVAEQLGARPTPESARG